MQPIRRPDVPRSLSRPEWVRQPIDAFILARLDKEGLSPAPEADRATLIRRVTFDLTGLPPTPEQIAAFVADDAPDAYERLVDRLLASTHYGERWARHWLDVVRFAESHGYETNQLRPNAWPYRDYVIRALNNDTPFARFVREQLAGDALGGDWLTEAATGFLVGGTHDVVGNQTVEGMLQQRADDLDDIITATATTFLGLTVNCARCHDHKFDPILQKDYYGLAAVFAGVNHAERTVPAPDAERRRREAAEARAELALVERTLDATEPLTGPNVKRTSRPAVNSQRNVERFLPVEAKSVRFTVKTTSNGIEPCIDELEIFTSEEHPQNVAPDATATASSEYPNAAIHKIVHINDGLYGNSHSWISQEPGAGWIQLDLPEPAVIDRIAWGRDRLGKFQDRLPVNYRIEVAVEPGEWRTVASSEDRAALGTKPADLPADAERAELLSRRDQLRQQVADDAETLMIYAGTFSQPGPTHLLRRGDPQQKGEEVPPSGVRVGASRAGDLAECPRAGTTAGPGRLDRRPREPVARAGDGQPGLALPLRPGDRPHAERFRIQRRPPESSRTAGLAGR